MDKDNRKFSEKIGKGTIETAEEGGGFIFRNFAGKIVETLSWLALMSGEKTLKSLDTVKKVLGVTTKEVLDAITNLSNKRTERNLKEKKGKGEK